MFSRILTEHIRVSLSLPQFADAIFSLTDQNRDFLRQWLPWLDTVTEVADTRSFLEQQLQLFAQGKALHLTIFYDDVIVGLAGYNQLDRVNGIGYIGYWLGEAFNGKGIMTEVVRDLVDLGRAYYSLQRVEIRCATANQRSRAIPERLGFQHEGSLRRAEKVYDQWLDHEIYARLLSEEQNDKP